MNDKQRDNSIDVLRSLGIIGIILAHTSPPAVLMQLRGFDVPLMVLLSGYVYSIGASSCGNQSYWQYCSKRLMRLLFPTWIFLIIYYGISYGGLWLTGHENFVNYSEIISNVTLMTGWYIWIIRVFIVIMLFAPLLLRLYRSVSLEYYFIILGIIILLFERFAYPQSDAIIYYLTMTVPYICVFGFGCVLGQMKRKNILAFAVFCLLVWSVLGIMYYRQEGSFVNTDYYKYPPRIYYTSYAVGICLILWLLRNRITSFFEMIHLRKIFVFVGSHTIWIYYWHIIILTFVGPFLGDWASKFILVFFASVIITLVQHDIVNSCSNRISNPNVIKYLKMVLIG